MRLSVKIGFPIIVLVITYLMVVEDVSFFPAAGFTIITAILIEAMVDHRKATRIKDEKAAEKARQKSAEKARQKAAEELRQKSAEEAEKARITSAERKQKAAEEKKIRMYKEEQDRYQNRLVVIADSSITLFELMPDFLKKSEEYLNQAEVEFSEGAFTPFWNAIERSAETLGRFNEEVQAIRDYLSEYTELIKVYESVPPQFPLSRQSVEKLSVSTSTINRMEKIVRTAQCDFQFATIYEQRKTNQILIAGFTNLAQALDQMTWTITASINNLAGSVDSMASNLSRSMSAINSQLGDMEKTNIKHNSKMIELDSYRSAREESTLQILENMQRTNDLIYLRDT